MPSTVGSQQGTVPCLNKGSVHAGRALRPPTTHATPYPDIPDYPDILTGPADMRPANPPQRKCVQPPLYHNPKKGGGSACPSGGMSS